MDPITHAIVGLSLAVLSGEPISMSNPAMLGCVAGAVIPDIDIVMQIKGDYNYLKNHRGISHSLPILAIFTIFITGILLLSFKTILIQKVLFMTFIGCLSHVLLDLLNSYGAQLLWPFYKKKIAFDLLLIYDPVLLMLCALIIFPVFKAYIPGFVIALIFIYYLGIRYYMRVKVYNVVQSDFGQNLKIKYMRVLPSMMGLIKWHFVIITPEEKIIGEVNIYPRKFMIIKRFENIDKELLKLVIKTPIAEFFSQFTPIFHVECKRNEQGYIFNFIDLRYYMAKDFLHHATAILNKDSKVVTSLFHPYSKSRNVSV